MLRHAGPSTARLPACNELLSGRRIAYALVRPPGHHAERGFFGGFCYFNNAAIAAHRLSQFGKVAILDIDYHHGNGQQDIFYRRKDVLTLSIHGHPRFAYPYFSGFADERGEGEGAGYNVNYPLPETIDAADYLKTLRTALARFGTSTQPTWSCVSVWIQPKETLPAHGTSRAGTSHQSALRSAGSGGLVSWCRRAATTIDRSEPTQSVFSRGCYPYPEHRRAGGSQPPAHYTSRHEGPRQAFRFALPLNDIPVPPLPSVSTCVKIIETKISSTRGPHKFTSRG